MLYRKVALMCIFYTVIVCQGNMLANYVDFSCKILSQFYVSNIYETRVLEYGQRCAHPMYKGSGTKTSNRMVKQS